MQKRVYLLRTVLPSLGGLIFFGLLVALPVRVLAQDTAVRTVKFSPTTYQRGFAIVSSDKTFRLRIDKETLSGPAVVTVTALDDLSAPGRKDSTLASVVYQVDITGENLDLRKPLNFTFAIPEVGFVASVSKFDSAAATWEDLGSELSSDGTKIRSADDKKSFTIALFQSKISQVGVASYYGTYTRTTRLTLVAASNTFPLGELLRVTNLENNKVVTVRVVDTGGFHFPRVIDLSTPAFAKIEKTSKGVARVKVEKATAANRPAADPEPLPAMLPNAPVLDGATPPTTAATASIVVDVASGQKLLGKKTGLSMPIASLTKLMTAAVVMDTKPDLLKVVTFSASQDNAECSCLYLTDGEQVKIKDLLYGSLVGSANNATLALARSTGLPRAEFVARMNEKAAALGMIHTTYVEPTGLEAGNVSSAEDLAMLLRVVSANPTLQKVTSTPKYTFKSSNTVCSAGFRRKDGSCWHTFVSTNKLFGKTSYKIISGKTGYIDEARHTFVLRGRNKDGHDLIVVLLKTYNKADSFNGANMLMNWTFEHAHWT